MTENPSSDAGQIGQDQDEADRGWDNKADNLDALASGFTNEDFWILIRRFNKQVFHLKKKPHLPSGSLDFNVADDEEFSANKLRSQFERLYMGVIVGLLGTAKHVARLRSWHETRRTAVFCLAYFAAWAFDWLSTLLLGVLTALILSPKARNILFPPAPLAMVSYSTGGLTKPPAGVLGSTDSATGAPEAHKGEALENEASNFVTGIAAIAMNVLVEKDSEGEPNPEDNVPVPKPNTLATRVAVVKDKASGVNRPSQDKTKVPMEKAMWTKVRPLMHALCVISDAWERTANLLSPIPPFHRDVYRKRLVALVVPLLVASRLITSYMAFKSLTFMVGVGIFGNPLLPYIFDHLNNKFPQWRNFVRLDCTLLRGVPTNVQLAIALLRSGEANNAPFPPPPVSQDSPSQEPIELSDGVLSATGGDQPLNATDDELQEAISHNPEMVSEAGGPDTELSKPSKHGKKGTKVLDVLRGAAKAAAGTAMGANRVIAKSGSEAAKTRLGVVPQKNDRLVTGPFRFAGRYHGKIGHIEVITEAISPCIAFVHDSTKKKVGLKTAEDSDDHWTLPITEFVELKKNPGYGFKSKLMMGWALDKEISDGIEIIDKAGITRVLTAVPQRDALFNRLCAIGEQKWESW